MDSTQILSDIKATITRPLDKTACQSFSNIKDLVNYFRQNDLTLPQILTYTFMSVKRLNPPDCPQNAIFNINKVVNILNIIKSNKLIGKLTMEDVHLCKNKTLMRRRKDRHTEIQPWQKNDLLEESLKL